MILSGCPDPGSGASTSAACLDTGGDGPSEIPDLPEGCDYLPGCVGEEDTGGSPISLDLPNTDLPCEPDTVDPTACCVPDPGGGTGCYESAGTSGPTDPTWLADTVTGAYYRWATQTELDANDWPGGTVLMAYPVLADALVNGSNAAQTLPIPLPDPSGGGLVIEHVSVDRKTSESRVLFALSDSSGGGGATLPGPHAFRPEFHTFAPTWINPQRLVKPRGLDIFARAYGDSFGGVSIRGITPDVAFDFLGPTTAVFLEKLPPVSGGVLVGQLENGATGFDDVVDVTLGAAQELCDGGVCVWEPDPAPDAFNCGDCYDNDGIAGIDGADPACVHRPDFGCDDAPAHNHGWENTKTFALLPDLEWCTAKIDQGMPWHTELFALGKESALVLNLLAGTGAEAGYAVPSSLPTIRHTFSFCVTTTSESAALDCQWWGTGCPADYKLGDTGTSINPGSTSELETKLSVKAWEQLDSGADVASNAGLTPRPVNIALVTYAREILGTLGGNPTVGIAFTGNLQASDAPVRLGTAGVEYTEEESNMLTRTPHEIGHTLGLYHTGTDPYFGERGFMQKSEPPTAYPLAILGPFQHDTNPIITTDDYGFSNEWLAWIANFPSKFMPRPQGFGHTGCGVDADCPAGTYCHNAQAGGVCLFQ